MIKHLEEASTLRNSILMEYILFLTPFQPLGYGLRFLAASWPTVWEQWEPLALCHRCRSGGRGCSGPLALQRASSPQFRAHSWLCPLRHRGHSLDNGISPGAVVSTTLGAETKQGPWQGLNRKGTRMLPGAAGYTGWHLQSLSPGICHWQHCNPVGGIPEVWAAGTCSRVE